MKIMIWKISCDYMEEKGGNLVPNGEKISFSSEHLITATGESFSSYGEKVGNKNPCYSSRASIYCYRKRS